MYDFLDSASDLYTAILSVFYVLLRVYIFWSCKYCLIFLNFNEQKTKRELAMYRCRVDLVNYLVGHCNGHGVKFELNDISLQ